MPDVSSEKEASEEPDSAILSMNLYIDGESVPVIWEENESVNELKELASTTLTVKMSKYGGFEQVGRIGSSISRNDLQTTTAPGDIVLYSGDRIVIFYGSNSWAYTRLGRLDIPEEKIISLLSGNDVEIELRME